MSTGKTKEDKSNKLTEEEKKEIDEHTKCMLNLSHFPDLSGIGTEVDKRNRL